MRLLLAALLAVLLGLAPARAVDRANVVVMTLATGDVVIELLPAIAPQHVERIKKLVSEKFYDGVVFHRVIQGFMAQTGDPTGTGSGGSSYPDLGAEFTDTPFKRGTLGAARTANPNSANSQFFICFTDDSCAHLQGQYTVFGQVIEGMENIDKVKPGSGQGGVVDSPDKIVSMRMAQ
jgi:peptidylprolyl isomerase